jgi:hypothetical protein
MPVLRQHTVLLDTAEAVVGPSTGAVHQFTPSDGDVTSDAEMGFVAVIVAERIVDDPAPLVIDPSAPTPTPAPTDVKTPVPTYPAISILIEGSFDKVRWARLATATIPTTGRNLDRVLPIGSVPPFLRARVYATNLATSFTWTAYVAVGANAPYRARVVS